ncbi:unnamed protein product, partial [marine sediment metagenome]
SKAVNLFYCTNILISDSIFHNNVESFFGFDHNLNYLLIYLVHGATFVLPLFMGLIIGFIAPFNSHKTFAIVLTILLGIGFIVTDFISIIRQYKWENNIEILVPFLVVGTILSLLHLNASLFLSRKIRKDIQKKKGE